MCPFDLQPEHIFNYVYPILVFVFCQSIALSLSFSVCLSFLVLGIWGFMMPGKCPDLSYTSSLDNSLSHNTFSQFWLGSYSIIVIPKCVVVHEFG